MTMKRITTVLMLGALGSFGCAEGEEDAIASYAQALNACEETVPTNRYIDGFPAYAQCSAYQNGAIYSNNGIDTSATKVGNDWVQTQPSGGYQCTELVHRYWVFKWNVRWLPRGNAGTWCDTVPPASSGVVQTTTPVHGDAIVLAPGSCGASAMYGHTALVDVVDTANSRVTVVEQNQARRGTYNQSCAKCFLHLVANDGSDAGTANKPAPGDAGILPPRDDAGGAPPPPRDAGGSVPGSDAGVVRDAAVPLPDAAVPPINPPGNDAATSLPSAPDAAVGDAAFSASADAGSVPPPSGPAQADEEEGGCAIGRTDRSRGAVWSVLLLAALLVRRRRLTRVAACGARRHVGRVPRAPRSGM